MNDGSERAGNFVNDLGNAARNNPLSAALIGMGVLWLVTGRRGTEHLSDTARNAWQGTSERLRAGSDAIQDGSRQAMDSIRERGSSAADRMVETGSAATSAVKEYAAGLPDVATSVFDDVRSNLTDMFQQQPLALGAVGIAIGAAIAASIPATDLEASYLGETSDFVKEQAGAIIGEQAQKATDLGSKVVEAVIEEAREQGLTVDGLKSTATLMSEKVQRVAEVAVKQATSKTGV